MAQILPRGPIEGRLCLVAPTGVRDSTLKKKQKRNENENFSHYLITTYLNMKKAKSFSYSLDRRMKNTWIQKK